MKSERGRSKAFQYVSLRNGLSSNCGGTVCCKHCVLQRKCGISDCLQALLLIKLSGVQQTMAYAQQVCLK